MEDNIPTAALHALARQIPAHDTTSVKIYEKAYKWALVFDNKFTPKWVRNITLVQIDRAVFSKGVAKSSYKMRDVTQQDCVFVAKFGLHNYLSRNTFFNVSIVQAICTQFADKFNSAGEFPIKLKVHNVFVLELVEKMTPHNVCTGELFLDGEYEAREVSSDPNDPESQVFQAFNHFVIVKTNHEFCLSHFQIVQNVITSAVIHTKSGKGFTEQNQGQAEFLRFADSHVCNSFCKFLNLPEIDKEKIKEVQQPVMKTTTTNGVPIRRTAVAAATEKVVSAGNQASFVSQKRAVFLQNQDMYPPNPVSAAIAATASVPNVPSPTPSPTPYQSSPLNDSAGSSPPPTPTPPSTSTTTAAPSSTTTHSAPTTATAVPATASTTPSASSTTSFSSTPPSSSHIASPTGTPAATPPTPRKYGAAGAIKSPQLTAHSAKPLPDLKPALDIKSGKPTFSKLDLPKGEPKLDLKSDQPKPEHSKSDQAPAKPEPSTKSEHPKSDQPKSEHSKSDKSEPGKQETKTDKKPPAFQLASKQDNKTDKPTTPRENSKEQLVGLVSPRGEQHQSTGQSTPATLVSPRGEQHQPSTAASQPTPATLAQAPTQTTAHDPQAPFKAPAPAGPDLQKLFGSTIAPPAPAPVPVVLAPVSIDEDDTDSPDITIQFEEIVYEYADEITDYDGYSDDEYYEEEEIKPLPPLPEKSPNPPNLRKHDHTYAKKNFRVRWLDLLDFEKNLYDVQQARKGGGEGIVIIPPPKTSTDSSKQWDLKSFRITSDAKGSQAECITGDDNPYIYTGSSEGYVSVWDVEGLKVNTSFKTHSKAVKSLVLRDDVLYTGSSDTNIASWDINSKKSINKTSSKAEINALAISVAHNLLFSAENDKTIKVWDLHSLQYVTTLNGHTRAVKALCVLGNYLFSGSNDQQVFVWNLNTQKIVKGLVGHEGWIRSIHAQGSTLYTGSQDETIRLWDLNSTECFQVIQAKGPVQSLLPTSQCLFSAAGDYIEVWNNDYQSANVLNNRAPVLCMFNKDTQLFCGSIASSLKVWSWD